MWLVTTRGFYSAVAKQDDGDEYITVRARSERDIRNLADLIDVEPQRSDHTDYRWRIRCRKEDWAQALATMAREIDYDNFKSRVGRDDPDRAHLLHDVWSVLYELQRGDA